MSLCMETREVLGGDVGVAAVRELVVDIGAADIGELVVDVESADAEADNVADAVKELGADAVKELGADAVEELGADDVGVDDVMVSDESVVRVMVNIGAGCDCGHCNPCCLLVDEVGVLLVDEVGLLGASRRGWAS